MKTLYIDTASSWLYTGIVDNQTLITCRKEKLDKDLSSFTLPIIKEMLDESHIKPKEIDRFVVVNGPGSFTGIRIGITIAKTWAWSFNKPIITISSLEAMAYSAKNHSYYVPMINARRGYYYAGIYDRNGVNVRKDVHIYQDVLEQEMSEYSDIVIVTNDEVETKYPMIKYDPDILEIVLKTLDYIPVNPHAVEPNYLKQTEAEEKSQLND